MNDRKRWWETPSRLWKIDCHLDGSPISRWAGDSAEGRVEYPGVAGLDSLRGPSFMARSQDVRIMASLNMRSYPDEFVAEHSDWEQITADGKRYSLAVARDGKGTVFCVNSGWREWVFFLIGEALQTGIDALYLDGPGFSPDCCYCPSCQMKFLSAFGRQIPRENWHDPLWKGFLCFRENSLSTFLYDAQQAAMKINPESIIFLDFANWEPLGWRAPAVMPQVGLFSHSDEVSFAFTMAGKYLRAENKPLVIFPQGLDKTRHHLQLPLEGGDLALAQIASSGTSPFLVLDSSSGAHSDSHEPFNKIFGFIKAKANCFADCDSLAEVGLLFSKHTNRNYLSRFEEIYRQAGLGSISADSATVWAERKKWCEGMLRCSYTGYFQALIGAHIQFDILLDQDLTARKLFSYRTIILPDAACLDYEAVLALRDFVGKGGSLMASFEAGLCDAEGDFSEDLFDLMGIERVEGAFPVADGAGCQCAVADYMGFKAGDLVEGSRYALKVKAAGGIETPLFFANHSVNSQAGPQGLSSYPALLINDYGKGKVAYFPEALGHYCAHVGMTGSVDRIGGMAAAMNLRPLLKVEAPPMASVEAYRDKEEDRIILHLVNNRAYDRSAGGSLPVKDMRISIDLARRPQKVYALRESGDTDWAMKGGRLEIHIPLLELYKVISIDY